MDAFEIRRRDVVTLVGAGGKTTFMYVLAEELAKEGRKVITTTTTKIWKPTKDDTEKLVVDQGGNIPADLFLNYRHVTCVTKITDEGKVVGVDPSKIHEWKTKYDIDCIIVEADGSKSKPFKAPASYEPIIPPETTLYVVMIGVDAIDAPLNSNYVHRPEIVAKLSGASLGDNVTPAMIGTILKYYLGMRPKFSRPIIFVNKVSTQTEAEKATSIIRELKDEKTLALFGSIFKKRFWQVTKGNK